MFRRRLRPEIKQDSIRRSYGYYLWNGSNIQFSGFGFVTPLDAMKAAIGVRDSYEAALRLERGDNAKAS